MRYDGHLVPHQKRRNPFVTIIRLAHSKGKMRRLTRRERLEEQVKQMDVFHKVEPDMDIQESSLSGAIGERHILRLNAISCNVMLTGAVTVLVAIVIGGLILSELIYYNEVSQRRRALDRRYDTYLLPDHCAIRIWR